MATHSLNNAGLCEQSRNELEFIVTAINPAIEDG
jgi:hypothetical protein